MKIENDFKNIATVGAYLFSKFIPVWLTTSTTNGDSQRFDRQQPLKQKSKSTQSNENCERTSDSLYLLLEI